MVIYSNNILYHKIKFHYPELIKLSKNTRNSRLDVYKTLVFSSDYLFKWMINHTSSNFKLQLLNLEIKPNFSLAEKLINIDLDRYTVMLDSMNKDDKEKIIHHNKKYILYSKLHKVKVTGNDSILEKKSKRNFKSY